MKRFLITVFTNWCGEDNTYSAWAEDEGELESKANLDSLAYDNFADFGGFEAVLNDLFQTEDREDLTDTQIDEAYEAEVNYYRYDIEEWDEERPEEEWSWYELHYDGRIKEEEENGDL